MADDLLDDRITAIGVIGHGLDGVF
jgi:hypothetical protein